MFLQALYILVSETYVLDAKHSKIEFHVNATAHRIHGKVTEMEGRVEYNREDGSVSGYVKVPVKSMKTGNTIRDNAMYRTLKESKHPEIIFKVKEVSIEEGEVSGTLFIGGVGVERKLKLSIKDNVEEVFVRGKFDVRLSSHKLKRPKFGFLKVDDKVDVEIDLRFLKEE